MAEATVARVGESQSVFSNPAGLAHTVSREVSVLHTTHLDDMTAQSLSYTSPTPKGGWGAAVSYMSIGGIAHTEFDPSATGTGSTRYVESGEVDAGDQMLSLSWGQRLTYNMAWGASVKVAQEVLDDESAVCVLGDAGVVYRVDHQWRVGGLIRNVGTPVKFISESSPSPTEVRAAVYCKSRNWFQWELDGYLRPSSDPGGSFGVEMSWRKNAFLRAGYVYRSEDPDLGAATGVTAGVGFRLGLLGMDYAFIPLGDLGISHRISMGWRFGGETPSSSAARRPTI